MTDSCSSPADSWPLDQFVQDPGYLAYQEELRCLIFNTAQTAVPSRETSPVTGDANHPGEEYEAQVQTKAALSSGRRLSYLKNYVAEVAPWVRGSILDMFDSEQAFTVQVPILARQCPALLYAMLALSARQMERKEARQHSFDSLELYQEAIRRLNPLLQARDLTIIPICVILCCLEMMSASPHDWRRHLEGCAALFDTFEVNGFSGGLLQAVFWCYARMDLCGALISDGTQGTLVPLDKWFPPGCTADLFQKQRSPDMHANYSVYLCSRVCELIGDRTRYLELGEDNGCDSDAFERRWLHLWHDLQNWLRNRPPEIIPVKEIDSRPFPQILFVHWAGISSNQLYHTACTLLLGSMPRGIKLDAGPTGSAIWHAKCICGISLTNPHQGCLNNAIQPLWIAGRLLSHKSEHTVLSKLIQSIEAMTGWATCWRIADLEHAWGYKVR
ncbi:fungal-specific transcription factor domain-containing protein [Mariannaea sp. PMI_226]|nr:fungal-specific transcription factor domain-containing protein [Mariannaea sp. PMI_226]